MLKAEQPDFHDLVEGRKLEGVTDETEGRELEASDAPEGRELYHRSYGYSHSYSYGHRYYSCHSYWNKWDRIACKCDSKPYLCENFCGWYPDQCDDFCDQEQFADYCEPQYPSCVADRYQFYEDWRSLGYYSIYGENHEARVIAYCADFPGDKCDSL